MTWTVHANTAQLRSEQKFKDFLAAPHVTTAYLLHDSQHWIDYALDHCDWVVVRPYNAFKDNHKFPDETLFMRRGTREPLGYLETYHKRYKGKSNVRWIFTNEPEHSSSYSIRQQIKDIADHTRSLAENKYGVAMGGWAAAKTIQMNDNGLIDPEAWHPAIEVAHLYRDWVNFDWHEYITAKFQWPNLKNHQLGFPQIFLDWPALTDPNNWGDIPREGVAVYKNYYLGRRHAVREYARSIGMGDYYEGMGESPWDSMWEGHWKDFIDNEFEPLFGKPKGIRTLRRYFAWLHFMKTHPQHKPAINKATVDIAFAMYTTEQFNKDLISDLSYWNQQDSDFDLYSAFFAYTMNEEWEGCCDISSSEFEGVIDWMKFDQSEDTVPDTPKPDLPLEQEFIRSTDNFTNIRSAPSTTGTILGRVPNKGVYAIVLTEPVGEDEWRLIDIPDVVKGYVAFKYITRERPPTLEIKLTLTPEQIQTLRNQLKDPS